MEIHQRTRPTSFDHGDLSFDLELTGTPRPPAGQDVLIPAISIWNYGDLAYYPDDAWKTGNFVQNNQWRQGFARFGYGIGSERTVINGGTAGARRPSALFRHTFDIADPALYAAIHIYLQRDDGAAVYLNGTRLPYNNLAANATVGDFALSEIPSPNHLQLLHRIVDHTKLVPGRNLLAVEVHQFSANGSDLCRQRPQLRSPTHRRTQERPARAAPHAHRQRLRTRLARRLRRLATPRLHQSSNLDAPRRTRPPPRCLALSPNAAPRPAPLLPAGETPVVRSSQLAGFRLPRLRGHYTAGRRNPQHRDEVAARSVFMP